jgi:hypothetical protein
MPPVRVKGKQGLVRLFAVINTKEAGAAEGPKDLEELRKLLKTPRPDLSRLDMETEEKKYMIEAVPKPT